MARDQERRSAAMIEPDIVLSGVRGSGSGRKVVWFGRGACDAILGAH